MSVVINIFILAMTVKQEEKEEVIEYVKKNFDIKLSELENDTIEYIKSSIGNRYFEHPKKYIPFKDSDSIGSLIDNVIKIIREEDPKYDILPFVMDDVDVGSPDDAKYDFLMNVHIRIIDSLSLISKRIKFISDLLEKNFTKSSLVLCCEKIPETLREELRKMKRERFPLLCIHKERYKLNSRIKLDIPTEDEFIQTFGSILKEVYLEILAVGKPIEDRVYDLGTPQHIRLKGLLS